MKALLALVLVIALSLAGCSGDNGKKEDEPTATSSATTSSTGPAARPNQAPTGSIALSTPGGPLPLVVNVTLTGSDPDRDNLTWTLAFGDGASSNGTALPADASHNYTAAGNYTLVYTLSDGEDSAVYNATLNVTASAAANAAGQTVSGSWTVGTSGCSHNAGGTFEDVSPDQLAEGADVFWGYFAVDPATWGATWTVTASGVQGDPAGLVAAVEMDFYATDGTYMEYTGGDLGTPFSGTVPENAGHGFVFPCDIGPGSFDYVAAFV